jgi:sRNA-binding carbon storage regulator CsrA
LTIIDLLPGQSLAIGPDITITAVAPRRARREPRAALGIDCPRTMDVRRAEVPARRQAYRPPPARPALEAVPGATRRPGPPVQRRIKSGGGA